MNKQCHNCMESKPSTEFNFHRGACKLCQASINKSLYEKNKAIRTKCTCGMSYNNSNKYAHVKTKFHIRYMNAIS